jgi:acetylglutamate kinase
VKVGGAVAKDAATHVLDLVASGNEVCVVHGAGPQISVEMERAGIPVRFVGGRRVTTAEAIQVVFASLETVNAALCEALGERAVPFFGHEIGFKAVQVEELGLVGDPRPQDLSWLERILDAGKIPVVAPSAVREDDKGFINLNVNADDAAAAIAVSLDADRLVFLTNVEGFLLDGEVVDSLAVPRAEELFRCGTLDPTILPKLGAAIEAARWGVRAFIGRTEVEPAVQGPYAVNRRLGGEAT